MQKMASKRKSMSLSEKKALLETFDNLPKMSQREAAIKLNCPQSLLCRILKNRGNLQEKVLAGDRKRSRSGHFPEVDAAIIKRIRDSRERNAVLSGPLVMVKADFFVDEEEEEEEEEENNPIPTIPEMRAALETLHRGLLPRGFSHHSLFNEFESEVKTTISKNLKQAKNLEVPF